MANEKKKMGYKKRRRLLITSASFVVLVAVVALVFTALGGESISLFKKPSELTEADINSGRRIKMGGLVKPDSLMRLEDGLTIEFIITDCVAEHKARYFGAKPPALFEEGQGAIVEGKFNADRVLIAESILAKHDENYTPRGMEVESNDGVCEHPSDTPQYEEMSSP